jgi:hypothetical protein
LIFAGTVVAAVLAVVSLMWLPGLAFRPLVRSLPVWLELVVGVLLFDVLIYWTHRWSHTVPLLWRFHAVHHSTRHLDWVSGFRNHPLDGAFMAPVFAFFIGAGFDGRITGGLAAVQFVIGLWAHLNVRWRLRPLHRTSTTGTTPTSRRRTTPTSAPSCHCGTSCSARTTCRPTNAHSATASTIPCPSPSAASSPTRSGACGQPSASGGEHDAPLPAEGVSR